MADDGVWRTIKGRRVLIKRGQTLNQALEASGKFKKVDLSKSKPVKKDVKNTKDIDVVDNKKSPELQKAHEKALEYKTYQEFEDNYASDLMDKGLVGEDNPIEDAKEIFKDAHYENSLSDVKEISRTDAIATARGNVRAEDMSGWFRDADSDYKPNIENAIITNPEVRNAGLNMAHQAYQEATGKKVGFNEFINSEIEVYRGGNFDYIDNDVFVAYSFSKEIAESFVGSGAKVISQKVLMKDTLGSLQTDKEAEVMVRRKQIKGGK